MDETYSHSSLVFLTEQLGQTITAALSGTRDRADIPRWVEQETEPTTEQIVRINCARLTFQRACDIKGSDVGVRTVRAWFIGGNVGSQLDTPITGIREDRFEEVEASFDRLIKDEYFGVYSDEAASLAEKYCGVFLI